MKKYIICLLFVLIVGLSISFASDIEVRINYGKLNLPTEPIIMNNRILVPLKVIAEIFGAKVKWDPNRIVTVDYNGKEIILPIGSDRIIVDNDVIKMDAKTIIEDSYTMVPLKFLSEYLDTKVEWYEDERIVNLVIEDSEIANRAETVSRSYAPRSLYPKAIGKLVVIDAGHGGSETGAYYEEIAEKDINLEIAKIVKKELEEQRVVVHMTRSIDATTSLAYRSNLANSLNAELFVSIHNNAIIGRPNVNGTEILYKDDGLIKNGITNNMLAENLQELVSQTAGTYAKGLINRTNLYVLNHTYMPAVIVEVGYMTNTSDLIRLKSESFREKAGEGIALGILKTLQEMG